MPFANLSWITPRIATGGDLSYHPDKAFVQVLDIVRQGVTHILDIRSEDDDSALWAEVSNVEYHRFPTTDAVGHSIPHELFADACDVARKALATKGTKIFVHCHMGVNRGPSVALAILLDQGYDVVQAFDLIRKKRPIAALAYAQNALTAHWARVLANVDPTKNEEVANALAEYTRNKNRLQTRISEVWTPEERNRIQRVIRQGHAQDAQDRVEGSQG